MAGRGRPLKKAFTTTESSKYKQLTFYFTPQNAKSPNSDDQGEKRLAASTTTTATTVDTSTTVGPSTHGHGTSCTSAEKSVDVEPLSSEGRPPKVRKKQPGPELNLDEIAEIDLPVGQLGNHAVCEKKRKFQSGWLQTFKWLQYSHAKELLFCKLCIEMGLVNSFTQGCNKLKIDCIRKHEKTSGSNGHKLAVETKKLKESMKKASRVSLRKNEEAVIAQMKNVYWAVKNNCANSMVAELAELCKIQGVEVLDLLDVDGHTNYQHSSSIHDMQDAISNVITNDLLEKIRTSDYYSVLLDESTDISVDQNLLLYVRFVNELAEAETHYLKVKTLKGAKAQLIYEAVNDCLVECDLDVKKIVGVATDGAANMIGHRSGVVTLLKNEVGKHVVSTHCIAHRLALASGKAADKVEYLVRYQEIINAVYKYFEYSPKRSAALKEIHEVIKETSNGESARKFKEVFATRWLSFEGSLRAMIVNYCSLIDCLLAEENMKAKAKGILKEVGSVKFMYTTYFLADAVGLLASLSRSFQATNIDLASINPLVEATISSLEALTNPESHGTYFRKFLNIIPRNVSDAGNFMLNGDHQISDSNLQRDQAKSACEKFVKNAVENLKTRFLSQDDQDTLSAFSALFSPIDYPETVDSNTFSTYGEKELQILIDHYADSGLDSISTSSHELSPFKRLVVSHFKKTAVNLKQLCKLLIIKHEHQFPGLATLAKIALTLPVSTVDVERGFSCQNLIKVKTRSCLLPSSLHKLMSIKIEGPPLRQFDFVKAFKLWAGEKPRILT